MRSNWFRKMWPNRRPIRKDDHRVRSLGLEWLEDRTTPANTIAQFAGDLTSGEVHDVVPIHLTDGNFTIPGSSSVTLGFVVTPATGSLLRPNPVTVHSLAPGANPHILQTVLPGGSSLALAKLKSGDHEVRVNGTGTGEWSLKIFLAGEVTGDFSVTSVDHDQIRDVVNGTIPSPSPSFVADADADRDGRITGYDLARASENRGVSTQVRILTVTTGLDPASDTGVLGDSLVNRTTVNLIGVTQPGATLALDNDGDGFDDGTATAGSSGSYILPAPLREGANTLRVRARDAFGQEAITSTAVALDTQLTVPTFDLSAGSDTGAAGDRTTTAGVVTLVGRTDPGETVTLRRGGATIATALASGTGTFQFAGVSLALGANPLTAHVMDIAGNVREFSLTLNRVAPDPNSQDVALRWNQATLNAIRLDASAPPVATRVMAMVGTAIFDAVSAIEGTPGYLVKLTPPAGASAEAAAASAAHRVLSYLYPGQQAAFDAVLTASLAQVPPGPSQTAGVTFGRAVGDAVIALRANDGSREFIDYTPPNANAGTWKPTTPMYAEALLPQWATVTPFALNSPDQFRPAASPALTSAAYATALNEVKAKGRATGSTRTADETQAALFWADGLGTVTPAGHWNQIAMQLAQAQGYGLSANARLFAQLNVAMADAAIACWDAKYFYDLWRPVTAIREAGSDGNSATAPEADWTPLLVTPNFPSYSSGHSTFSGAAQIILESIFGAGTGFTATTEAFNVSARTFTSFQQAAEEAGRSRILGGIHFSFDNQAGLTAGRSIANYVLQSFSLATDTRAPSVSIQSPVDDLVSSTNVTVRGQVLDNLSGVKSLEVQFDGGSFSAVALDANGNFAVPTTFPVNGTADGVHTLRFRATDFAGNVSTSRTYSFRLDTQAPTISLTAPTAGAALTAASRLTGVASGTGSALTALSYSFNGGASQSVVFDPSTGSFDEALDLSTLAPGSHTLTVTARDAAGNIATTTRTVTLAAAIPLAVTDVSPGDGSTDVGATQRPKITFSRAILRTTLNGTNFFAKDTTGAKLPGHVVVADDNTSAWLFLASPMPGASTITITVDGATIRAADGSLLDAAGTGTPGSKLTLSFSTVSRTSLPGTSLTGIVADPGPDLRPNTIDDVRRGPDGILMTADDIYLNPIANVKVYILGQETQVAFTDAQGRFTLASVPSGNVKLVMDGMTATNAPAGCYFPEMTMDLTIEPGKVNTVMGSMGTRDQMAASETIQGVYLPRLKSEILRTVSNTVPTIIDVPAGAAPDLTPEQRQLLSAQVQPGTAIGANGQVMTNVQVGISTVPPELIREMLPQGISEPPFTITVQAPGVVAFSTPVAVSYPNVDNAAPGTKMLFISFDHATGRLVLDGTATVSADGKSVVTDPDSGITHPGWHFVQVGTDAKGKPCVENQVCVQVNGGRLGDVIEVNLSGTGGRDFELGAAFPNPNGFIALVDNWDTLLRQQGKFYFVPYFPDDDSRFTQAPKTFELPFSGIGRLATDPPDAQERRLNFTIQFKEVRPGYSTTGSAAVPTGQNLNIKLDVYRVQQRLRYLGYQSSTGDNAQPVEVDGLMGPGTRHAIGVLNAAVSGVLNENHQASALVSEWINAANAPRWVEYAHPVNKVGGVPQPIPGTGAVDNENNHEHYMTSWVRDSLIAFDNAYAPTFGFNGASQRGGGDTPHHSTHEAGMDLDIDISVAEQNDAQGRVGTTGPLSTLEQAVVDRMRTVFNNRTVPIGRILVAFPRILNAFNAGVGVAVLDAAHDDHFHVDYQPPPINLGGGTGAFAFFSALAPTSTAPGFGTDTRFYYRIEVEGGIPLTGRTTAEGGFNAVLAPNSLYTATFYQASTNRSAVYTGRTNGSGRVTEIGTIILDQFGGPDADGDGIPDVGELAIGTNPNNRDSDADGIPDAAELEQGLDPLNGRSFPTGVIATLPLQGNPERIAVEGDRIYAATGGYGLAVIDGTRFDGPILLGQLDLPGTATDIGVDANLQIAAVATGSALQLVDVSDGALPQLLRTVNVSASRVLVANGLAYAASGNQLRVVDLASGSVIQSLTLPGSGTLTGFAREGTFLYAYLSGSDTFSVIDIANEGAAVVRGQLLVSVPSFDVGLFVGNGVAWLSGFGLRTINVSNPDSPQIIQVPAGGQFFSARRMALNGSGLGLLLPDGGNIFQVYDTSNPSNVANFLLQLNLSGSGRDIAVSRGVAYVATSSGLEVVNYLPFDNRGIAPTVSISTTATDIDLITPGLQVLEGTSLPVRVAVSDDVQVRNVELLVNGQVARTDVSFPFDFFAIAPQVATGVTSFTLQVRATDTGGNVSLSNTLTIGLVTDTSPPTITSFVPPNNSSQIEPIQTVQVRFSKPMNPASVTASTVRVRNGSGTFLTPTAFQLRDNDRLVQLTFPPLLVGNYQIVVSAGLTDRAGNVLSTTDVISTFALTPRASLSTSASDADPGTPGLQVFEGTTIPLTVTVAAGVSVQKVELLVNGVITATDTSAPYQFSAIAPNIAPGANSLTLQAKVTDTSGLATFTSPPLEVGLLEDVTPPTVVGTNPGPTTPAFEGITQLTVTFSEPIAPGSISAGKFRLFKAGASGVFDGTETEVSITGILVVNDDTQVQVNTPALAKGNYQLRLTKDGITDRALNPLGTGLFTSSFTLQEQLLLNGSFETGNFSGWTITASPGGGAQIVTSWAEVSSGGPTYQPKEGTRFAVLESGQPSVYQRISQQFTVQAGDIITGWAFFDAGDYLPFNDNGYVQIFTGTGSLVATPFSSSVSAVGDFGRTPWTQWQYTFSTAGTYRIEAGVTNLFDSALDSYLGIDAVQVMHGLPQFFAGSPIAPADDTANLTDEQLQPAIAEAIANLTTAGYNVGGLDQITFQVSDLPGSLLGWTVQNTIWIDVNAAGYGWYTDVSPESDDAFTQVTSANEFQALPGSSAYGRVDLLTVVTHELGHILGFASIDPGILDHDWMTATLGTGLRRAPTPAQANGTEQALLPSGELTHAAPSPETISREFTTPMGEPPAAPDTENGTAPRASALRVKWASPTMIESNLSRLAGGDEFAFDALLPWEQDLLAIGGPSVDEAPTGASRWMEESRSPQTPGLFPPGWDETPLQYAAGKTWWFESGVRGGVTLSEDWFNERP